MDLNNKIEFKIKAKLDVDDATADICMQLITIHAKNHGAKGLVLRFNEKDNNPSVLPLMTDKDVYERLYPRSCEEN